MSKKFLLILIVLAGIIVFSNSLGNDFIWDDESFIINNTAIKNLSNIPLFFTSNQTLAKGTLSYENYRPLVTLSYALNYSIGGLNPFGYHLVNLIVHILNAILIFYLIHVIVKDKYISFFTALIFLVHPVQVEAVSWISGHGNVLFLFFYIIILLSIRLCKGTCRDGDLRV